MSKQRQRIYKSAVGYVAAIDEVQGIVEAVVSVFGVLDDGDDVIQSGAFAKTIVERGHRLRVLDQHRTDTTARVVGLCLEIREVDRNGLPEAVRTQYPDATGGLYTKTQYLLNTPEGLGTFRRIQAGALGEYSIGFDVISEKYDRVERDGRKAPVRTITEVRLWEYSPVIWGMNPATVTVDVKSGDEPIADDAVGTDTQPIDTKATIGTTLQSTLLGSWMYQAWLKNETITLEEYEIIVGLMLDAAKLVSNGLPDDLRNRLTTEWWEAWADDGPDAVKAGRVLSAKNYGLIREAHEALSAVMASAAMADDAGEDADTAKAAVRDEEKATRAEPAVPVGTLLTRDELERARIELDLAALSLWGDE